MSATTWLENTHLVRSFNENKTTLIIHCEDCGKFKTKRSLSPKCTVCLFGMSTKEAIKRGYIQS